MPATYANPSFKPEHELDQQPLTTGISTAGNFLSDPGSQSDSSTSDSHSGGWRKPNTEKTDSSRTLTVSSSDAKPSWCTFFLLNIGKWLVGSLAEDLNRTEAWLLLTVVVVNFLSFCAGSILAPVLPQHLAHKMVEFGEEGSVSEVHVSLAFVLYAGTSMSFSLVFGPLIPRLGVEYLYYTGLVTVALTNISLGVLDLLPITTYQDYILAQCIIRVLEGIGAAAFNTSSHSIIMRAFSRHIDEAFAAVEAAVAISFSLGPVIGSFLVSSFGWFWAFLTFGTIVLSSIPVSVVVFNKYGSLRYVDVTTGHDSLLVPKLIFSWKGFFVVFTMITTTTAYSFMEPTLEMFLEETIKTSNSTLFYFAGATAFAFTALAIAPFVAARSKMGAMISGTAILGVGFLVVGPVRYISSEPNSHATMTGVILMGLGFALAYVPTLDFLVDTAIYNFGSYKGPTTYGPISGLWNFLNGFGETFGPVIALFQKSPDIRDSSVIFAVFLFGSAMILMLIFFHVSIDKLFTGEPLPSESRAFLLDKDTKLDVPDFPLALSFAGSDASNYEDFAKPSENILTKSTELGEAIIGFLTPGRRKNHKHADQYQKI